MQPSLNGDRRDFQPVELSQTGLKTLLCPYRFQMLFLRGITEDDTELASFGTHMHTTAAVYGAKLIKSKKFRDVALYAKAMDEVVQHFAIDLDTELHMQELGEVFVPMWSVDPTATRHAFEERIFVDRGKHGDRLAGTPDHVAYFPTRAAINEFKFGPGQNLEYDEAAHDLQLGFYAYLLLAAHPEIREVVVNKIAPAYGHGNISNHCHTRDTLGFIEEAIADGWLTIDTWRKERGERDWDTNAHHEVCKWCDLICPAIKELRLKLS